MVAHQTTPGLLKTRQPHTPYLPNLTRDPWPLCRKNTCRVMYVDDTTVLECIDLPSTTLPLIPTHQPHGLLRGQGLGIPGVSLAVQHILNDVNQVANVMDMSLNLKKTNLVMFNPTKIYQAIPYVAVNGHAPLQVVEEVRLLGLLLDSNLTWWPLVTDIYKRCSKKLWCLVRLRDAGATPEQLITMYKLRIRSILDYCAPAYHPLLNGLQSDHLEKIQRRALQIIRGREAKSYRLNRLHFDLSLLSERREELTKNFAIKTLRSHRHTFWYTRSDPAPCHTRVVPPRFKIRDTTTQRAEKSPITYMSHILNSLSEEELGNYHPGTELREVST